MCSYLRYLNKILSGSSDFATCSTGFYGVGVKDLCGSDLKHCKKIKFSKYVHQTLIYTNYEQRYA